MHNAGKYKSCSFVEYPEHNLNCCNLVTCIRTLDKTIGDTGAARWLVNNMLPRDVGKGFEVRLAEQQAAESKTFQTQAYAIGEQLNKALARSVETGRFTDMEEAQKFVNDILAPGEKKLLDYFRVLVYYIYIQINKFS